MSKQHKIVVCLCGVTQLNLALWPNYCPSIHIYRNYRIYRVYIVSIVYISYLSYILYIVWSSTCHFWWCVACVSCVRVPTLATSQWICARFSFPPPAALRSVVLRSRTSKWATVRRNARVLSHAVSAETYYPKKKEKEKRKEGSRCRAPPPSAPLTHPPRYCWTQDSAVKFSEPPKQSAGVPEAHHTHGCSSAGGARCLSPPDWLTEWLTECGGCVSSKFPSASNQCHGMCAVSVRF